MGKNDRDMPTRQPQQLNYSQHCILSTGSPSMLALRIHYRTFDTARFQEILTRDSAVNRNAL
jgi:hypothetical protein